CAPPTGCPWHWQSPASVCARARQTVTPVRRGCWLARHRAVPETPRANPSRATDDGPTGPRHQDGHDTGQWSVITDKPITYFRLTQDALHEMNRRDPALASALDGLMIHLLAERLMSHNNKTTAALPQ